MILVFILHCWMNSMKKLFALLLTVSAMMLCSCVYHPPFQQGNILTPTKVQTIKPGMTSAQVITTLGSPVLKNMYVDNRMTYIYTSSPSCKKIVIKKVIIAFANDQVVDVRTAL